MPSGQGVQEMSEHDLRRIERACRWHARAYRFADGLGPEPRGAAPPIPEPDEILALCAEVRRLREELTVRKKP